MVTNPPKTEEGPDGKSGSGCLYVKVSMDGAPYLRKVDLKIYDCYKDLTLALEKMFSCFTIGNPLSKCLLTLAVNTSMYANKETRKAGETYLGRDWLKLWHHIAFYFHRTSVYYIP